MKPRRKIGAGDRFGRLVVLSRDRDQATCRCDCGATITLKAGDLGRSTKSCGCYASDRMRARNLRHGEAQRTRVSTEWVTWRSMRQRCTDPKHKSYPTYGGRGITVCPEWDASFETFLADMGPKPRGLTLERRNNDRGYSKANCYWATRSEQAINRRERPRLDDGTFAPGMCAA